MDPKYKKILDENRVLLARNIIPTKEFYDRLQKQNVLTESMLSNIASKTDKDSSPLRRAHLPTNVVNRDAQINSMIDMLLVRVTAAFHKFCDVLQVTGHHLLADHLRNEALSASESKDFPGGETPEPDVFRRFPSLNKALSDVEKQVLDGYIKEREREAALTALWKGQSREKQIALDAKQKQMEESWEHMEVMQKKDVLIHRLEDECQKAQEALQEKTAEYMKLLRNAEEAKEKHKLQLDTQMNFNSANDSTLRRLQERITEMETALNDMDAYMEEKLRKVEPPTEEAPLDIQHLDNKQVREKRVRSFLDHFDRLYLISRKYEDALQERQDVLKLFAIEADSKPFYAHMRNFHDSNSDRLARLFKELEHRETRISEVQDEVAKVQGEKADLEKTIEDLNAQLAERDKQIRDLKKEIQVLRSHSLTGKSAKNTSPRTIEPGYVPSGHRQRADSYEDPHHQPSLTPWGKTPTNNGLIDMHDDHPLTKPPKFLTPLPHGDSSQGSPHGISPRHNRVETLAMKSSTSKGAIMRPSGKPLSPNSANVVNLSIPQHQLLTGGVTRKKRF
ncbi:centrosomal protein of 290 kDa isoform X2 [Lingula anatina]|uniref:Centrosomal protein of 290 kDa isoform X2 n=1 Tax=Lingula anatina TaxID=7574 RepID=A0A1S3HT10_LINAN|nr:centrosomal protein of 290 kDa isoform X2 [Lingula anatina]|eukprot:XP_013389177.1 centrosomal protein of 290 kDa isoform X2 [Lingula anatina]